MNVKISDTQKILFLVSAVIFFYIVYILAPILTPFLVAGVFAYLGDPIVDKLEDLRFTRTASVFVVFLIFIILILSFVFIIFPLIQNQISHLLKKIPSIIDWIYIEVSPWLSQNFSLESNAINLDNIKQSLIQHWQSFGSFFGTFLLKIFSSAQLLIIWLSYALLIPIVTFYLLRDWDILITKISQLIPRKHISVITKLSYECNAVLAEFFRGQLIVISVQSVFYSSALWFIGLEFSLLIGLIAGIVSFIPYLGVLVGIVIASIAAFLQFHEILPVIYVFIVFGAGQILEGMILTPLLIGERIGLHPIAVIFAVMAGAQLLGLFGMIIALPVAAIILVLLKYYHKQYLKSDLYNL
tara:strand:- start:15313 stop:16377 length:1065 start_codon:yes stop_codon:yes gene_type:complete